MTCRPDCRTPAGNACHCGACHRDFRSVGGFDRHRRGGTCVDPATIDGLHLVDGRWQGPPMEPGTSLFLRLVHGDATAEETP